jgi:hypothetical protein
MIEAPGFLGQQRDMCFVDAPQVHFIFIEIHKEVN